MTFQVDAAISLCAKKKKKKKYPAGPPLPSDPSLPPTTQHKEERACSSSINPLYCTPHAGGKNAIKPLKCDLKVD